jgi:hypothetical protein
MDPKYKIILYHCIFHTNLKECKIKTPKPLTDFSC